MRPHMSCCRMDTSKWPKMPEQERKRKLYVLGYLETGSDQAAAKLSGLSAHHTRPRIAAHLRQYGDLSEAPHPRPSPKYTENVMKAALAYFIDNPQAHFATPELVSYLLREGLLEEPVNEQNFRSHLQEWLHAQGMTLRVGCRQMIFEITPERAAARLQWVREHLPLVDSPEKLKDIIIVDETTFEEGTHEKGKGHSMYPK